MSSGRSAVPRTAGELAELEASYQPFGSAADWRGLHVDVPRWTRYARTLARRITAAGQEARAATADRLIRAAALDSAALDGLLPANPELTAMVLSSAVAGPDPAGTGETTDLVAECHRRALVLAGEAGRDGRAVDLTLISVLQDVITESQASYTVTTEHGDAVEVELPRRQFKPVSNYMLLPGGEIAAFAPAASVEAEMSRLSVELGSPGFAALHPAVQAAYAHYALTAVHPFADGNGRLARTIASVFLLRAASVPLLIFADQWPAYYQALAAATQGHDLQALVDHVSAAAMAAMDLAVQLLAGPAAAPVRAGQAGRPGTPSAAELDAAARGLLETLAIELREALVAPPRSVRMAISASREMPAGHIEPAYRLPGGTGRPGLRVCVRDGNRGSGGDLEFVALVSTIPGDLLPVALREVRSGQLLEVALADAYPLAGESAALRIGLWARRLLAAALDRLEGRGP